MLNRLYYIPSKNPKIGLEYVLYKPVLRIRVDIRRIRILLMKKKTDPDPDPADVKTRIRILVKYCTHITKMKQALFSLLYLVKKT